MSYLGIIVNYLEVSKENFSAPFAQKMRRKCGASQSGFLYEFFSALGAGNGDLSLSLGHTHALAALGAGKIPMLPILDLLHQKQKFPVFLIPLIGISGKAAEKGGEQADIRQHCHQQICPALQEHGHQTENQPCPQNHRI